MARRARVIWIMAPLLAVGACSSSGSGSFDASGDYDSTEIYAAAAFYLATQANTFGPGYRFSELLVVDQTSHGAGNIFGQPTAGFPLGGEEQAAIQARLEQLSPTRFVSSAADWIDPDGDPVIPGAAILTLGPVILVADAAVAVEANIWCGTVCALWTTIRVEYRDGAWMAVADGPRTIS